MEEKDIQSVMKILSKWNPLGEHAKQIKDLDNYRTEAIDILSTIDLESQNCDYVNIVQTVINQAFEISISRKACKEAARKIWKICTKSLKQSTNEIVN